MKYKVMKLLCMFDLPVETKSEQRQYRKFRKNLIEEGFIMMQYSIYVRTCPTREFTERMIKRLKKKHPPNGNVRLLTITEKQYDDMVLIIGSKNTNEESIGVERLIII